MSSMGVKIKEFDYPVCNRFKAKILNNHLCYEVDLSMFAAKDFSAKELKLGFNFIIFLIGTT